MGIQTTIRFSLARPDQFYAAISTLHPFPRPLRALLQVGAYSRYFTLNNILKAALTGKVPVFRFTSSHSFVPPFSPTWGSFCWMLLEPLYFSPRSME